MHLFVPTEQQRSRLLRAGLAALVACPCLQAAEAIPSWIDPRGPNGTGVHADCQPPTSWGLATGKLLWEEPIWNSMSAPNMTSSGWQFSFGRDCVIARTLRHLYCFGTNSAVPHPAGAKK